MLACFGLGGADFYWCYSASNYQIGCNWSNLKRIGWLEIADSIGRMMTANLAATLASACANPCVWRSSYCYYYFGNSFQQRFLTIIYQKQYNILLKLQFPILLFYLPKSMELTKQKIEEFLYLDEEGFLICKGIGYKSVVKNRTFFKQSLSLLQVIVNTLGQMSAVSQGLKQQITSIQKFNGTNQRLYIKIQNNLVLGFVKVGEKNLFYRHIDGFMQEIQPTCVLDIYVHQSCQRSGFGKKIFEKFLMSENKTPEKLAYDRPSSKLVAFLKKHYNLASYLPQNNNFIVFNDYFGNQSKKTESSKIIYTEKRKSEQPVLYEIQNRKSQEKHRQICLPTQNDMPKDPRNQNDLEKSKNTTNNKRIRDSLQILTQQIERVKTSNFIPNQQVAPPNKYSLQVKRNGRQIAIDNGQKSPLDRYWSNGAQGLLFHIPWATTSEQEIGNFRTTSKNYGSHYSRT